VVPTYAGKYFPGHAAVLAPFAAAGVEWLPTCLELAAASAVLYVLLRRAGLVRAGAVFACAVHQLSGRNLLMATTLLSHGTSTLLALASLLVIPRIDAPDAYAPTMTASALTGFSLLTRPYSAIAAFPLIALRLLRVRPRPGTVLAAAGPLLLAVALLAGFDKAVTGSITTTPWSRWARQYTPYDGPGFGTPSTAAPERPLPAHFAYLGRLYWSSRKAYTVAALPHIASQRLRDLIGLLPSAPLF